MIFVLETSLKEALMPLLPILFQKSQELLILSIFALLDLRGELYKIVAKVLAKR